MKRIIGALATLVCSSAFATTYVPVQMLNPTGSTAGQAVVSTGPTSAPAWGAATLSATTATEAILASPGINIVTFPGTTTDYSDFSVKQTNAGSHATTSNSAFSVNSVPTGSGMNGPSFADYGATVSVVKNNFLTSTVGGEIDGLTIVTRQGLDDTDGILINVGGVSGFMGLIEGVTSQFQATTGTILKQMDAQIASIETGRTGAASSIGYLSSATVGTWDAGLQIQSQGTAGYTNAIVVKGNSGGATTFTVTPAGVVTANGGVTGVANGSSAAAGIVGETPTPTNLTSVALSTAVPANVSSATLSAGDYQVQCTVNYNPAGSTLGTVYYASVSGTSATVGPTSNNSILSATTPAGAAQVISSPDTIQHLSSATTLYCVANAAFSVSTMSANGFMNIRRVR